MTNPIFTNNNSYNKQQFNIPPQIRQLFQQMQGGVSPQAIFQQLSGANPQALQNMQQFMRQTNSNVSSKDMFYMVCKQKGINPDDFMSALGLKL